MTNDYDYDYDDMCHFYDFWRYTHPMPKEREKTLIEIREEYEGDNNEEH